MASKMAASKSNLSTQRTFDSTDDLLQEEQDEEVAELPPARMENTTIKVTPFWDCRAIHWPAHSAKSVAKYGFKYLKSPFRYAEVVVLGVFVYLCYILPDYLVAAHHRPIPVQQTSAGDILIDLTFANAYHENETIPGPLLTLLCVYFPIGIFALICVLFGPRGDPHATLCAYLFTMGSKIFLIACIKNYAGYLRPSFYDMCEFDKETLLCEDEATSARESFPSGHAATALSSMTLLSLFLLGKVTGGTKQRGAKEVRGDPRDELWTPSPLLKILAVLSVAPIALGMFIATSRVRDNWHHPADIVCGGIIGAACAFFGYSLWYPPVFSHYAGIPRATVASIITERKKPTAAAAAAPKPTGLDLDEMVDMEVDVEG